MYILLVQGVKTWNDIPWDRSWCSSWQYDKGTHYDDYQASPIFHFDSYPKGDKKIHRMLLCIVEYDATFYSIAIFYEYTVLFLCMYIPCCQSSNDMPALIQPAQDICHHSTNNLDMTLYNKHIGCIHTVRPRDETESRSIMYYPFLRRWLGEEFHLSLISVFNIFKSSFFWSFMSSFTLYSHFLCGLSSLSWDCYVHSLFRGALSSHLYTFP